MNATFGFAKPDDLPRLLTLMRDAESVAQWPGDAYARRIVEGSVLLANIDRHLVGAVIFSVAAPDEWEIENVAVDRAVRRQGIGKALMRELSTRARQSGASRFFLEVRASSGPAIALYRSVGFVESGRRRNYYQGPAEDALVFALAL